MNRFLIINPFGIGDVLFTTPVIKNLREKYPGAFIGYVVNCRALSVVSNNPHINKIFIFDREEFSKDLIRSWIKLFQEIRQHKFDVVIDFSLQSSFDFLTMACGIKRRVGYNYRGRGRFLTDKVLLKGYESKHVVEYNLDLLDLLGIERGSKQIQPPKLELFINQEHHQWAKDWFQSKGIESQKSLIAVIPGGGASWGKEASQKRWPIEKYALLVDKIIAKSNAAVILMGDQKELSYCHELIRKCSSTVHSAVGETTVLQMAALLQQCSFAIVNDGGPLHIAVAAGVRTVSIFGPVDPVVYGPYPLTGHTVIEKNLACQPCYRQFRKANCHHLSCLNDLSVEDVYCRLNL